MKVELAVNVEELFPRRIRRWLMIGSRRVRLNRQLGVLERARAALSGKERFDSSDNIARALKPALVSHIYNYMHVHVKARHQCYVYMTCNTPTPGHLSAAVTPCIGRNASCTLGDFHFLHLGLCDIHVWLFAAKGVVVH